MPKLCILVPAYNSAHFLPDLVKQISENLPSEEDEIIILDDGSSDDTFEVAKSSPRVKAFSNGQNKGYGYTSHRLYQLALENGADYGLHMHSDFGHDPKNIGKLIKAQAENGGDVVVGSRLCYLYELLNQGFWRLMDKKARNNMPLLRVAGHFAVTAVQNFCYGTKLHCFHEGMRLTGKKAMEWIAAQDMPLWYQYDGQLYMRLSKNNFQVAEIAVPPLYVRQVKSSAPPFRYGFKCLSMAIRYKLKRK
ncbi:MAG: glycosyltransferase family 2 protein [Deltaproteobacteria bacterium]|jgi:glycosyltransferase involved in cell wall biosynthesis|nr:glycosyltransferase family 2 protein [Deltaproteobacteria bacterium]